MGRVEVTRCLRANDTFLPALLGRPVAQGPLHGATRWQASFLYDWLKPFVFAPQCRLGVLTVGRVEVNPLPCG